MRFWMLDVKRSLFLELDRIWGYERQRREVDVSKMGLDVDVDVDVDVSV